MSRDPKWLPFLGSGNGWEFVSYRGRWLGGVVKGYDTYYIANKLCCAENRPFTSMREAARWVETTLFCKDCLRSCLALE